MVSSHATPRLIAARRNNAERDFQALLDQMALRYSASLEARTGRRLEDSDRMRLRNRLEDLLAVP